MYYIFGKKNTWKTIWKSNDRKNCNEKFKIDGVKRKTYATNLPPPVARCALLCFYSAASTLLLLLRCSVLNVQEEEEKWQGGEEVAQHVACHMPRVFGQLQSPFPRLRFGPSEQARERERNKKEIQREEAQRERERGIEKGER